MSGLGGFIAGTMDLWFLFSALFAIFVAVTLWRAAQRIRVLRARLDRLERREGNQELGVSKVESRDWVPR